MEKERLKPQPISITMCPDQLSRLRQMNINISKFIRRILDDESWIEEEIDLKIKEHESEIQRLRELKNKKKKDASIKTNLSKEKVEFLRNAKETMKRDPFFIGGQLKLYNNSFGEDIDKQEFEKLLREIEDKVFM